MASVSCPICQKASATRAENPAFPFCSERCRLIDLGHWLTETYRVPDQREDESAPQGSEGDSAS